jgi:putative flippase GtrA
MTKIATTMHTTRREGERFFKFLVVGGIGFVVDAATLYFFTSVLRFPDLIGQAFSFLAAVVSNFTWNRYWTYPDSRTKRIRKQLSQFTLVNTIGLASRSLIFWFVLPIYRAMAEAQTLLPFDPAYIARYSALATSVVVVLLWNFFVNRYWTYGDVV